MKKKSSPEEQLANLNALQADPGSTETLEALRRALRDRSSRVVAKAARLVGELEIAALAPELVAAFDRLLVDPVKSDPGCAGKTAVLEALNQLEHLDEQVFLKGIRYVQREAVWGGSEDTAASLRGVAAFGLIQARYPDVAIHLVDLLADPERAARMAAARALAYWGRPEAALLLRLALLHGDPEAEVMGECFNALLKLREAEAVPFVAEFLSATRRPSVRPQGVRRLEVEVAADPAVAEAAAMALGQSRCAEAIAPLKHAWEHTLEPSLRQVLLVSLALLRQPAATEFLVTLIAGGGRRPACDAVAALGPFLYDPALREQVARAVEVRGDPEVRRALREAIDRTEG